MTVVRWLTSLLLCSAAYGQRGDIRHVHDPVIAQDKGAYYIFSTGSGIPIRASTDLYEWKKAGRVFQDDVPAWAKAEVPGARDVWAPDISHWNGRFHLYYSVSTFGSQRSCIGLATNATLDPSAPDYRWVDHGKVLESFPDQMDFNAIDPNLVLDAQGKPYLVWGSYWGGIKLVRLDPQTGKPAEGEPIHGLAARPGVVAIEAPFIIRHDGLYYLFVSFDRCCRGVASDYRILAGRSREITGPYVDFAGRPMLEGHGTLVLAGYDTIRGPGHNGFLRTPEGDWLVHHMYDVKAKGMRTLQIRPLSWGRDGWPLAGEPIGPQPTAPVKVKPEDLLGIWHHRVDFDAGSYIELLAEGRVNSAVDRAAWKLNDGLLELRWPNAHAPGGAWIDACYFSPDGKVYIGRNQGGAVVRGENYQPPAAP
jgi:arabinan endo-1,5-alpha-L-arabinosidase